jgi:tripeptide aminopeptidase
LGAKVIRVQEPNNLLHFYLGLEPVPLFPNGGLDANWFDKHGVPTVKIGAWQYEIHTVNEYVDPPEFASGCRLAVALATLEVYRRE